MKADKGKKLLFPHFMVIFLLLVGAGYLLAKNNGNTKALPQHAEYIGPEMCAQCHEKVADAFAKTIHGKIKVFEAAIEPGCESCHGPGSIHAEEADPAKIINPAKLAAVESSEICLKCHKGEEQFNWHGTAHYLNDVTCVSCHNTHNPKYKYMLAENDPKLCFTCHREQQARANFPSHHPIKEGKMNCNSCHATHGSVFRNLREATTNELCLNCHSQYQGPFVYQHEPVVENCTICHDSHGSVANNLKVQNEPFLCMRCHPGHEDSNHPAFTDVTWRPSFYTKCTQCHVTIHGTDLPSQSGKGRFTR